MAKGPKELIIRTYQVGFGDCFLLTFKYPKEEKHVLIDFGTTRLPEGYPPPSAYMATVAQDIAAKSGHKLTAVVATHRHKDHISGFATNKAGTAAGDIIKSLGPEIVLQPWTETPELQQDARGPKVRGSAKGFVGSLQNMHSLAENAVKLAGNGMVLPAHASEIRFVGDDNIANRSAVENLAQMGQRKPLYLSHGERPAALERLLPGVRIDVLGPPNLRDTDKIRRQRSTDRDEFWHLQAASGDHLVANGERLFPDAPTLREPQPDMRWFCEKLRRLNSQQLLGIVRTLDRAMNNTSLILLFTIGNKRFLFPGDAQFETWQYALREANNKEEMTKELAAVDVYKVGHHGSLNATPISLWEKFDKRKSKANGRGKQLTSLLSTLSGVHGATSRKTEVPRSRLVHELDKESKLRRTDELDANKLCDVVRVPL